MYNNLQQFFSSSSVLLTIVRILLQMCIPIQSIVDSVLTSPVLKDVSINEMNRCLSPSNSLLLSGHINFIYSAIG